MSYFQPAIKHLTASLKNTESQVLCTHTQDMLILVQVLAKSITMKRDVPTQPGAHVYVDPFKVPGCIYG